MTFLWLRIWRFLTRAPQKEAALAALRAETRRVAREAALDAKAAAAQRAAEHQAFLDALAAVVEIARSHASANESLSTAIQAWLQMFHTTAVPTTWTNTDLSEAIAEAKRAETLRAQGFPVDMPTLDQDMGVAAQPARLTHLFPETS